MLCETEHNSRSSRPETSGFLGFFFFFLGCGYFTSNKDKLMVRDKRSLKIKLEVDEYSVDND